MGCFFAKIFIHLSVIPAVCFFTIYKLIGWDLANIYLFKVNSKNTRKKYEICPKVSISSIETCSGLFTVNFEAFLLLTLNR